MVACAANHPHTPTTVLAADPAPCGRRGAVHSRVPAEVPVVTVPCHGAGMTFTGHVFLGMSVDGFIARADNSLDWLVRHGEEAGDAGFTPFVESIDAVLMGRGTYDVIADEAEWPYQGKPLHLLSSTLASDADPRVTAVHRSVDDAVAALDAAGHRRVYVDGGRTVRALLIMRRIATLTLSRVPVLIGSGPSLFGPLPRDVELEHLDTQVLGGGMVQTTYRVREATLPGRE